MKAWKDRSGKLVVVRNRDDLEVETKMLCPFQPPRGEPVRCGDHCPLFAENEGLRGKNVYTRVILACSPAHPEYILSEAPKEPGVPKE